MLNVTLSAVLSDKSACDTGKDVGQRIYDALSLKQNQPLALKDAMPHLSIVETLWCFRCVRASQYSEADNILWKFIHSTLMQINIFKTWVEGREYIEALVNNQKPQYRAASLIEDVDAQLKRSIHTQQRRALKTLLVAFRKPDDLSQMAIDISQGVIELRRFDNEAEVEEKRQRDHLEELLNA